MSQGKQCPICFEILVRKEGAPWVVCGGWDGVSAKGPTRFFGIRGTEAEFARCTGCWIEEILSDQGDLKRRLRVASQNELVELAPWEPSIRDDFCRSCSRRLALLNVMLLRNTDEELDVWRRDH